MAEADPLRTRALCVDLGGRRILDGITLTICEGERLALVGPNGCGKSTLLRALAGLTATHGGEVEVLGQPLRGYGRRQLAQLLAYMPQHLEQTLPITALDAVLLGRSPHLRGLGLASENDIALARQAAAALEVEALLDSYITEVSGGELQRLMFARVLVQQSRLMLLDEPTSAQDPRGALTIMDKLAELVGEGVSTIAAVHDLNLALQYFDRIAVLMAGKLVVCDSPEAVLASDALAQAFEVDVRSVDVGGQRLVVTRRL